MPSLPSPVENIASIDAIPELPAATSPIAGAAVALLDLMGLSFRLATSLTLATGLAVALGGGLFLAAQQFKEVARSSRHAVRSASSPQALAQKLRTTAGQRRTAPLEHLRRELDAAVRQLELPSGKDQRATTSN